MDEQRQFFYQVLHDLKNPMGAILGLSDIFLRILSETLNENQKEVICKIKSHSEFCLRLIEDLADAEKLSNGVLILRKEKVEVKSFLEQMAQEMNLRASLKQIDIKVTVAEEQFLFIDKLRFTQIMHNLISNAIKYSHERSVVEVLTDQHNGDYYIKVKDFGVGIKPEDIDRVFQPFCIIDNQTTANEKGTGLGLSIVKRLAELHNGDVFIESEPDKGTTVTVQIPQEAVLPA